MKFPGEPVAVMAERSLVADASLKVDQETFFDACQPLVKLFSQLTGKVRDRVRAAILRLQTPKPKDLPGGPYKTATGSWRFV